MTMRHHSFATTIAVLAALGAAAGCSDRSDGRQSSGRPASWASEPKEWGGLSNFTGISATGPDNVVVRQGPFTVRVEGDPEAIERLEIGVSGDTLKIGRKRQTGFGWSDDKGATIHVALPALAAVSLTGSGDVSVDKAKGEALDLSLTGSGDLSVASVAVRRLKADITGSGGISVAGSADTGKLSATGSGDLKGDGLKLGSGDISLLGSGDIGFASDGAVDISILGSGDVTVKGRAQCKKSVLGSGEVRCGG
jgi:hypothetical protein